MNIFNFDNIKQTYISVFLLYFFYRIIRDIVVPTFSFNFRIKNDSEIKIITICFINVVVYSFFTFLLFLFIGIGENEENNIKSTDEFNYAFNALIFWLPVLILGTYQGLKKNNEH